MPRRIAGTRDLVVAGTPYVVPVAGHLPRSTSRRAARRWAGSSD